MESVKESIETPLRRLWSLYLRRRYLCKQLDRVIIADDKKPFVKHFYNETLGFLEGVIPFKWMIGTTCLPAVNDCKNLHDIDRQLMITYRTLQADTSWEQEYPDLARFLMRNFGRVKVSLRLLRHLTYFSHRDQDVKN